MHGFRDALVELMPHLRRYALALTRNRHAADDLVQDALVRAIERRRQFVEGTNLRAWLFTIMHNIFIDQRRRADPSSKSVPLINDQPPQSVRGAQEACVELKELEAALGRLPLDQRAMLLLVGLEGLSYEEAAQVAGVAIGTVKSRLSRAREALRRETLESSERPQVEASGGQRHPGESERLLGWTTGP